MIKEVFVDSTAKTTCLQYNMSSGLVFKGENSNCRTAWEDWWTLAQLPWKQADAFISYPTPFRDIESGSTPLVSLIAISDWTWNGTTSSCLQHDPRLARTIFWIRECIQSSTQGGGVDLYLAFKPKLLRGGGGITCSTTQRNIAIPVFLCKKAKSGLHFNWTETHASCFGEVKGKLFPWGAKKQTDKKAVSKSEK